MNNIPSPTQLKPHDYPIFIKLIGAIVLGLFLYSVYFLPQYIIASRNLKNGERYLEQNQYDQAIESFQKALEIVPSSKKAKISLSVVYFSNENNEDDEYGLYYLGDITMDEYDWEEVSKVMPSEYLEYFIDVN